MRGSIQFRGPLSSRLKLPHYEMELTEQATLEVMLRTILEKESDVRDVWRNPESMDRETLILCNDVDIGLTGGLKTKLNDGDTLVVLPLIHGG